MQSLVKFSFKTGAILGLIQGAILLIPLINCMICFSFALVGAITIYLIKRKNPEQKLVLQDGALIGAISGFSSFITTSIVFLPIVYLLNLLFSPTSGMNSTINDFFLVTGYAFIVILILVFFIALLSALFNAFSGIVAAYIYERIETNSRDSL